MTDFRVEPARWPDHRADLRRVREAVFVREQGVPETLEWDGEDATAEHAVARDAAGHAIGTGRLLADGHIGRMAVLAPWRGRGVGRALLRHLLAQAAARGQHEVWLDAQVHAVGFYQRQGFRAEGAEFLDAGIPHRRMRRLLGGPQAGN